MHLIWTGFLLGLVGSLHCAGMCGPLIMAVPAHGQTPSAIAGGRLLYNLGRITTYCVLGLLFGLVGEVLSLIALQRWLSISTGVAILAAVFLSAFRGLDVPAWSVVSKLKRAFGTLLHRRTLASVFLLGLLNGLLPCGLVYIAAAAALSTGHLTGGALYMAAFGLGTLPMMLGLGLVSRAFGWVPAPYARRLVPACIALVALLLVMRGLGLGIPYLSPEIDPAASHSCH